jgi:hypothetical protein
LIVTEPETAGLKSHYAFSLPGYKRGRGNNKASRCALVLEVGPLCGPEEEPAPCSMGFLNHAKAANTQFTVVVCGGCLQLGDVPHFHVLVYASTPVAAGAELLIDYGPGMSAHSRSVGGRPYAQDQGESDDDDDEEEERSVDDGMTDEDEEEEEEEEEEEDDDEDDDDDELGAAGVMQRRASGAAAYERSRRRSSDVGTDARAGRLRRDSSTMNRPAGATVHPPIVPPLMRLPDGGCGCSCGCTHTFTVVLSEARRGWQRDADRPVTGEPESGTTLCNKCFWQWKKLRRTKREVGCTRPRCMRHPRADDAWQRCDLCQRTAREAGDADDDAAAELVVADDADDDDPPASVQPRSAMPPPPPRAPTPAGEKGAAADPNAQPRGEGSSPDEQQQRLAARKRVADADGGGSVPPQRLRFAAAGSRDADDEDGGAAGPSCASPLDAVLQRVRAAVGKTRHYKQTYDALAADALADARSDELPALARLQESARATLLKEEAQLEEMLKFEQRVAAATRNVEATRAKHVAATAELAAELAAATAAAARFAA